MRFKSIINLLCVVGVATALSVCTSSHALLERRAPVAAQQRAERVLRQDATPRERIVAAGIEQTTYTFIYDASYQKLDYPLGDVPADRGACTDVVIRAFRKAGVDLQQAVHEDLRDNPAAYPKKWGAGRPDRNIDHRRVPNLMVYFTRRGKSLSVTTNKADYQPGDVVTWEFDNGLTHTGLVTDERAAPNGNYLIVHNIGAGAQLQDVLFAWKITGHFRYFNETSDVPRAAESRR